MSERRILFENARVHTVDPVRPRASWFVVQGDRIQRMGEGPPPPHQQRVDLGGRVVVPGFVDAHAHVFQTGLDKVLIDLSRARRVEDVIARIQAAEDHRKGWVFAHSFDEEDLEDAARLTRHHLDEAFPDRPVWITRVDYHSAVVNGVALRRLRIPDDMRGLLKERGAPNGILRSDAYFHAKARVARSYPVEIKEKGLRSALDGFTRNGVTAVHALEGGRLFGDEGAHTVLKRAHKMPLHLTLFLQEENVFFTSHFGFRHLGGCILIDGSIGSYTAALDQDYQGLPGSRGVLYMKPRALGVFVDEAHQAGVQLAFHAIGPRAIDMVLGAYGRALDKAPRFDHRHRIEHFELATDEQIRRARDLGLVLSMQPSFEHYWGGPSGMYAARLGEGWRRTNRLRTILDAGLVIAGGSDTNVTPSVPLLGMHAAVNHPNTEQRITPARALRMFTHDAAYGAFGEKERGSIMPGKEANFVVLDDDPLGVATDRIRDVEVLETWYLGKRTYCKAAMKGPHAP